jgi:hypothetical protein
MLKNKLAISVSVSAILILSMSTSAVFWMAPYRYSRAQSGPTPNNSSSIERTIDNGSNTTNSGNPPNTFNKMIKSVCNITSTNRDGAFEDNRFLTYLNPYYGIIIQYPSNWIYKESEPSPLNSKAFPIVTFSPPLSFEPNAETDLQIWVENLDNPAISLDEYTRNVIKSYRDNNSNFKLILGTSTNSTISNGSPAYDIVFTDYSDNLRRKSFEGNVSSSAYYITFNTDASLYDKFNPFINKMINSFGIYDHRSLPLKEQSKTYIQGYNDGLELMIPSLCLSPVRGNETGDKN